MKKLTELQVKRIIIGASITGIVLIIVGIFLYYNFFRQSNANVIETVPTDASFIFKINDEERFSKSITQVAPYLNELFVFDAYEGSLSFLDKVSSQRLRCQSELLVSGHNIDNKNVLLLSTKMNESIFNELLKILRIDSRNYIEYKNAKIYSFGTHYKKFYFVCHHRIFSISESVALLKNSIQQHQQLEHLTSQKSFRQIYEITEKNSQQNWLLLNHALFLKDFASNLNETFQKKTLDFAKNTTWSAYQISFSGYEVWLNGYFYSTQTFLNDLPTDTTLAPPPTEILPFITNYYSSIPNQSCNFLFKLMKDSTIHTFYIVNQDSLYNTPETFFPEDFSVDSAKKYKNFYIYPIGEQHREKFSKDCLHTVNYFTNFHNYFLLADSVSSLQYYYDIYSASSNRLSELALYRTAEANLPSHSAVEMLFLFIKKESDNHLLFKNNSNLLFPQHLSIVALSFDLPKNDIVNSHIYIKF